VSDTWEQVYELFDRSLEVSEGEEQISLREEAVRLADLTGDLRIQYFAREVFVRACVFGGAGEKALVAFSWLLAQFDQHPGRFDQWAILWKYKWIVNSIHEFPQVPKARIYEMIDDLSARSQQAGYSLRAVYNQRYRLEKHWDNRELALEYFEKMQAQPRDELSNCPVCEIDERVSFAIYCGDDERGIALAQPLLNGDEKCATVPHRTYGNLLLPLVRLGRYKEALLYHRRGYEMISGNQAFVDRLADHLIFVTVTKNLERGIQLLEKHYSWTESNRDLLGHFAFFRAACLLFEVLAESGAEAGALVKLNLPPTFPLHSAAAQYEPLQLANWFREKAAGIARRFDKRNETDFFMRKLAETSNLKKLISHHPLS
jgi:hypothetical protein